LREVEAMPINSETIVMGILIQRQTKIADRSFDLSSYANSCAQISFENGAKNGCSICGELRASIL
jgi:hypothetical protein